MRKLPVFDVLGQAFSSPIRYWWPLLPVYLGIAIFFIGMLVAVGGLAPAGLEAGKQEIANAVGAAVVMTLLLLILISALAVLTHRQAAGVVQKWKLGWATLRYMWMYFVIGFLGSLLAFAAFFLVSIFGGGPAALFSGAMDPESGDYVAIVLSLITWLVVMIYYVRVSLALPATAIDNQATISLAWQITRGNTLRLAGAWILYFVLVIALNAVLNFIVGSTTVFGGEGISVVSILGTLGFVLVYYYMVVFGIAFLTYSYLALAPNAQGETPLEPARTEESLSPQAPPAP